MSASEFDQAAADRKSLEETNEALRQAEMAERMLETQLDRTLGAIFEDPERAQRKFKILITKGSVERAIAVAENRAGFFGDRNLTLGFVRGGMFPGSDRHRAREALQELPEIAREYASVRKRVADIRSLRLTLLDRLDRQLLNQNRDENRQESHTPSRGRTRTRSE